MHAVASRPGRCQARDLPTRRCATQLGFLGEDNLANLSAVKNLMTMAKNALRLSPASKSGLETAARRQDRRARAADGRADRHDQEAARSDPDEFWHFQAGAAQLARGASADKPRPVSRATCKPGPPFPSRALAHLPRSRACAASSCSRSCAARQRDEQHERDPAVRGRREEAALPRRRADRELAVRADQKKVRRRCWRASTSTRSATTAA